MSDWKWRGRIDRRTDSKESMETLHCGTGRKSQITSESHSNLVNRGSNVCHHEPRLFLNTPSKIREQKNYYYIQFLFRNPRRFFEHNCNTICHHLGHILPTSNSSFSIKKQKEAHTFHYETKNGSRNSCVYYLHGCISSCGRHKTTS